MPQRKCCVPSCNSSLIEGAVLHSFPNPSTDYDKFRNWVTNAGLVEEEDDYVFRNRRICHLHFEQIYHCSKNRLSKIAIPKLRIPGGAGISQDVICDRPLPMDIDECLPSTSESSFKGFSAETGRIPRESVDTAELLLFFDRLFDSVNGNFSKCVKGKIYRSAVTPKSPHHKLWHKSIPILKSMKFVGERARAVPSISSWIKTIQAFQQITKKLHNEGLRSLLLRNFNQDPLENFFGAIRAHGHQNIMPSASSFEASYKTLLMNNMMSAQSVGANCETDNTFCLQNLKYLLNENIARPLSEGIIIDYEHLNIQLVDFKNLLNSQDPKEVEKCAAVAYCSGWLINVTYKAFPKCSQCRICKIDLEGDSEEIYSKFIKLKKYSDKCILHYPSKCLLEFFFNVEHITLEILKTNSGHPQIKNYVEMVVTALISTNFIKCDCHKIKLTKFILNKSILLVLTDWCREVNNLLCGKNTMWDENDPLKQKARDYYVRHKTKSRK